jgi:endogenous inhibitor of DNA gyrase (YacG/DUF329 family)
MKCPHCRRVVTEAADARYRPFCSERCRTLDLGDWLSGRHAIPGPPADEYELAAAAAAASGKANPDDGRDDT